MVEYDGLTLVDGVVATFVAFDDKDESGDESDDGDDDEPKLEFVPCTTTLPELLPPELGDNELSLIGFVTLVVLLVVLLLLLLLVVLVVVAPDAKPNPDTFDSL